MRIGRTRKIEFFIHRGWCGGKIMQKENLWGLTTRNWDLSGDTPGLYVFEGLLGNYDWFLELDRLDCYFGQPSKIQKVVRNVI